MTILHDIVNSSNFWTAFAGLGGAALGGYITYLIQNRTEKRNLSERRKGLLIKYVVFVDRVHFIAEHLNVNFLMELTNDPNRHIKVLPLHTIFPKIDIEDPATDLLFLSKYENIAPLIGTLCSYRDRYQGVMEMIEMRNGLHLNQFQGALSKMTKPGQQGSTVEEIKQNVGLSTWNKLKVTTDALYDDIDFIIRHHQEIKTILVRNFKRVYPKAAMVEIIPTTIPFRVIIIGGTGQVGGAVVQALLATPACREIVMITRKPIANADSTRVRNVVMDTGEADFEARVADLSRELVSSGDRVAAISCVGVGSGSRQWSEEQLKQLEVGVVGSFARGIRAAGIAQFSLLSAAGSASKSRIKYARVMGLKEEAVQAVNFPRLAIFRPGIIVGNAHTPVWITWFGKLIPDPWGNIDQRDISKAFVAEIVKNNTRMGVEFFDNRAMRHLL